MGLERSVNGRTRRGKSCTRRRRSRSSLNVVAFTRAPVDGIELVLSHANPSRRYKACPTTARHAGPSCVPLQDGPARLSGKSTVGGAQRYSGTTDFCALGSDSADEVDRCGRLSARPRAMHGRPRAPVTSSESPYRDDARAPRRNRSQGVGAAAGRVKWTLFNPIG